MLSEIVAIYLSSGNSVITIVGAIIFGIAMCGIGVLLLFRPNTFLCWLVALNPSNEYARKHVNSLRASIGKLRFVGVLSLGWGAFVAYLSIRVLLHTVS